MRNTKCLILTYAGAWIDAGQLRNGIYESLTPSIYPLGTTINGLLKWAEWMKDMNGNQIVNDAYFTNLAACKLVEVELVPTGNVA